MYDDIKTGEIYCEMEDAHVSACAVYNAAPDDGAYATWEAYNVARRAASRDYVTTVRAAYYAHEAALEILKKKKKKKKREN